MPSELGLSHQRALSIEEARALEPSLAPVFRHAVHWPDAASVSNPLAVTKAYAAQFATLGGVIAQRRRAHAASLGQQLAGRHRRRSDRRQGGGDRARALGAGSARAARHRAAARLQARLSPAFPSARQRRPDAAGRRHRQRLLPGADGAGHPAHHRRGIRRPRRGADARAVRPADAGGARAVIRWAKASRRSPGWDRGRALPIHAR